MKRDTPGFYLEPALFTGVDNAMRIAREEIFGPVMSVLTFKSEAEAVALARDSATYAERMTAAADAAHERWSWDSVAAPAARALAHYGSSGSPIVPSASS